MTNLNNNTDLQNLLNKVEALVLDQDFRKAAAKTAKQFGCSLTEWNENKMPIIYKMAYQYVINN
jgi:hypothetical protein